jgi:hypothetical protein
VAWVHEGSWSEWVVSLPRGSTVVRHLAELADVGAGPLGQGDYEYDHDHLEFHLSATNGPVGRFGPLRIVDAGAWEVDKTDDDAEPIDWDAPIETSHELIVTANESESGVSVFAVTHTSSGRKHQVLQVTPEQLAWLAGVVRRYPELTTVVRAEGEPGTEAGAPDHRVEPLLQDLGRLWAAQPELRLGQLITNLMASLRPGAKPDSDLYFLDDEELAQAIVAALGARRD